jgi:hypothetical protein
MATLPLDEVWKSLIAILNSFPGNGVAVWKFPVNASPLASLNSTFDP